MAAISQMLKVLKISLQLLTDIENEENSGHDDHCALSIPNDGETIYLFSC